ncbi:bifunctional methylenetetrahydrofolate dehydrogenase/methenyltetrahydrofolate cyclohydrolase FolD [Marinococcus luteus]|uniref:bifunctional methylenetetrahydrofolate dehydrogenase/methenyltetrahydrofolate cyclohydrolase FolD n=1 Tax=Marinococcus luteus TaxID=1122204 RepID=UPI002ACC7DD4|nr:bifunctional methylenetetrahydrofolate dehydrogenase/methenyltetrahydrofolate cyclohydrolase FolD [Marinococcus luteus]MDZ5783024.1 bifunctional methylenetetrahydrofolate dehydrogenase/methenyltetrahydrofolate cyclohydrolase FolD [Marinococcus luteus]
MSAQLISGKEVAASLREEIKQEIASWNNGEQIPGLAVVLVGDNPASRSYVKGKQKASKEVGIHSELKELPESVTEEELLQIVKDYNDNEDIHGILVQLPLPDHISDKKVIETISPDKDVDGFHPINIGRMMTGQEAFLPCTPYGIIKMLEYTGVSIEGKHAVVLGRSNIVGKPMGQLLLNKNATVTHCHSRTKDLASYMQSADILIAAIGRQEFVKGKNVKPGAVVIDVGMNRKDDGKLCGDVDFEEVSEKASYLTPVPGGVGPMTITMLLYNTLQSAKRFHRQEA